MSNLISTNGKQARVSCCDYDFLLQWSWHCDRRGYFMCSSRGIWNGYEIHAKYLHWFITHLKGCNIPKGLQIDHIDRDKSNNVRSNLRLATPQQQQYNTGLSSSNKSGYKGVHFVKTGRRRKRWRAQIRLRNGRLKNLGHYKTPVEASQVYKEAARKR